MGKQEGPIEQHLCDQCKKHNIFIQKNITIRGIPDRLIMKDDIYIWIETKAPDKKPTKLQVEIMKKLKKQKATVYVADTKEKIDEIINELLDRVEKQKKER